MSFTINDSRSFTNYLSANEVDLNLQKKFDIKNQEEYKKFIQHHADILIESLKKDVVSKVQSGL
jgi:hypothetical protein